MREQVLVEVGADRLKVTDRRNAADGIARASSNELGRSSLDRAPTSSARRPSSTRLAPEASTRMGSSLLTDRKISDFTICETSQPTAAAASAAERVLAGITRTSLAIPRRPSSSATRASLPASASTQTFLAQRRSDSRSMCARVG